MASRPLHRLQLLSSSLGHSRSNSRRRGITMEAKIRPLSGLWKPRQLQSLYYGLDTVKDHLLECLPSESSKAFILSTSSLQTKTFLIGDLEKQLGRHHAGSYSKIGQHTPIADLDQAADEVLQDPSIDVIVSVGGGSPIDGAKAISHRVHEKCGKYLFHIAIPTLLSAAECTHLAGFTDANGKKTGVRGSELPPSVIFYDARFALETPPWLFLSTGLRALDHAVELMYHPTASEVPARRMALSAVQDLFEYLPKYKANPKDIDTITQLQLAAYSSLGFLGLNLKGGLGLSHALGYALGSPYGIPHGITSCLTLGHVVKLKAEGSVEDASQIARLAPYIGLHRSGDNQKDGIAVGQAILDLVGELDLKKDLKVDYNVGQDQHSIIAKTATGQESGALYDSVLKLVQKL